MQNRSIPYLPSDSDPLNRRGRHHQAMDLSSLAALIGNTFPHYRRAQLIHRIAAAIEEDLADTTPADQPLGKAILYRSAAWMYLASDGHHPEDLSSAHRCATNGIRAINAAEIPTPHGLDSERRQFQQVLNTVRNRRQPDWMPPEPKEWTICCVCQQHTSWSHHPPRPLTTQDVHMTGPIARLCSQCEWQLTKQACPIPPEHCPSLPYAAQTFASALIEAGRHHEATQLLQRFAEPPRRPELQRALALRTLVADLPRRAITPLQAIINGDLMQFGVPPFPPAPP